MKNYVYKVYSWMELVHLIPALKEFDRRKDVTGETLERVLELVDTWGYEQDLVFQFPVGNDIEGFVFLKHQK